MCAYVINIMVVLIIIPVILQTDINLIMLSIGEQRDLLSYISQSQPVAWKLVRKKPRFARFV